MTNPIDMKYVYKRERYLERKDSVNESYTLDIDNINPNSSLYESKMSEYVRSNPPYGSVIGILEKAYKDNKYNLLESLVTYTISDIIPSIKNKNLPVFISQVEEASIGDVNSDRLIETAKMYKSVDRIIKNHKALTEKFSTYDDSFLNKSKSDREKCFSICEFCDTYTISPFIKMNIALEEMVYRKYTEGLDISEQSIVENVLDYFLLRDNNTKEDIASYKRCIEESKVLSDNAGHYVEFLMEMNSENKKSYHTWKDALNEWKLYPYKSKESAFKLIESNLNNITALSVMVENCNDFSRVNSLEINALDAFNNLTEVTGTEAKNIESIIRESGDINSEDLIKSLESIYEADINVKSYNDTDDNEKTFTSSEIDKFRMQNLITDAQDAGEFLDQSEKSSMKDSGLNFKQIRDFSSGNLTLDESSVCNYVDNNNHISLKLKSYSYDGSLEDIREFADATVNTMNNILYGKDSIAYYTLQENTVDFYVRSKYYVILSDLQENARDLSIYDKANVIDIIKYENAIEDIKESGIVDIINKLNDRHYAAKVSANEVALITDILSPYVTEDCNFIESFLELCREEANPSYEYMRYLTSNIQGDAFDINEDHLERIGKCLDIMGLSEAKETNLARKLKNNVKAAVNDINPLKKKEDKQKLVNANSVAGSMINNKDNAAPSGIAPEKVTPSDGEDNTPNNESKGGDKINLNDVKLAWKSARGKLKNLDSKQAEICKDMDMEFNRLCGTIDTIVEPGSRESLVTGRVKVSLSKLIKSAIALAGVGAASGAAFGINPLIVPIMTVISLFGRSQYLGVKEKQQLIDEIDIELKVLDRELARAESDGSSNKYRQLLSIQRTLQRKRQELYFKLAKKGKPMPLGSNQGQQKGND